MKNYLVIDHGPFVGYMLNDLRNWLVEHQQEADIAIAMKYVHEKTSILGSCCDYIPDRWLDYAFEEWCDLEKELIEKIKEILSHDNEMKGTNYPLEGIGWFFIIEPFMNRNEYRNGSGWWIEEERTMSR